MRRRLLGWALITLLPYSPKALLAVSPQYIYSTIERARRAWLEGDGNAFSALFSPGGEFIVPGQKWCGPEAILEAFQVFSSTHRVQAITIRNVVMQDHRAIVEWYWEDQAIISGKLSRAEDAIAIEFQGEKIQRWREYIDGVSLQ